MAEVLHKTLPDSELHEPKGVAGAAQGSVYKANGTGSGNWQKIDPTMLAGIHNNGAAGQALILDGVGGFTTQSASAYHYGTSLTTGTQPAANVVRLDPTSNWTETLANNITLADNRFIFTVGGLYHASFTISSYNLPGEGAPDGIHTILVVRDGTALGAIANDWTSSTTLNLIFQVGPSATVYLQKAVASKQPGVLVQHAIHRIGG